jgi:aminoglycoside phosphotransferase (APT) family kinase protein
MTWLDGEPLSAVARQLDAAALDAVFRRMGQLLAAIHRITRARWGYVTTRVVDDKPSNTAYMTDQFARKLRLFAELGGDPALGRAVERHVARHAELFAACVQPVLCHNDFHEGNVLVSRSTGQWRVTGYVDVEGVIAADPLLDLAKTDYYAIRRHDDRRRAFLGGYGPLPADWAERVAVYRLHHALELWNWAASTGKPADQSRAEADLRNIIRSQRAESRVRGDRDVGEPAGRVDDDV